MNVFEDLIVELKEENLLENTAIDGKKQPETANEIPDANEVSNETDEQPEFTAPAEALSEQAEEVEIAIDDDTGLEEVGGELVEPEIEVIGTADESEITVPAPQTRSRKVKHGKEFFKKRAVDEMAALQMVEHILTGVEREYMKVVPKAFDDFNAKKALNNFLNIAENSNSEEHKAAEFALMQETEAWGLALIERDRKVAVANIRQYCENSRPALSSQAMLALARFYRNAPYSESIRSKFDFVITRLFSRPVAHDKRICLFSREEMLGHIATLYSEWASIPIYEADNDESNVLLTGLSFDDLAVEAENAGTFDQLIESDFFGRLRLFKESISELFYAPTVTASAIESNVRIGNAYVNLIVRERQKMDAASIQVKYGDFNDQTVSDAAGRTLDLAELLTVLTDDVIKEAEVVNKTDDEATVEISNVESPKAQPTTEVVSEPGSYVAQLIRGVRDMNRWLLIVGGVLICISAGLYIWSTFMTEATVSREGVSDVQLDNSPLSEHIKTGRISGDNFYGLLLPSWEDLTKEKREEYLKKLYQLGPEKGYKQVNLIGKNGKMVGYASATRIEVDMP